MLRVVPRLVCLLAVLAVLTVSGCGDDGDPDADAGRTLADGALPDSARPDAGVPFEVAQPAPPEQPMPAVLEPCPAGWAASTLASGETICDPTPGEDTCTASEARFLGEATCATIGAECPSGRWPAGLPGSGVRHVDPTAAAGGDGSQARPFRTVDAALAAASAGDVIALSAGDHPNPGAITIDVEIRGTCVERTRVTCAGDESALQMEATVTVRDLHVVGCRNGLYVPRMRDATWRAQGVLVTGARRTSVIALGGTGTIDHVVVRDPTGDPTDENSGWALGLNFGARLTARHFVAERAFGQPITISHMDTVAVLEDLVVRETRGNPVDGDDGAALNVNWSSTTTVRRALLEDLREAAVNATMADTSIDLEDVVVRRVQIEADGQMGIALIARNEARITGRRIYVEGAEVGGVWARDLGTVVDVEDLVVMGIPGHPDNGLGGIGVAALVGGTLSIRRGRVEDVEGAPAGAVEPGASLLLEDVAIANARMIPMGGYLGQGVVVGTGATTVATRLSVEDTLGGVAAVSPGSTVMARDVTIQRVVRHPGLGAAMCAVCAFEGATIDTERLRVDGTEGLGVWSGVLEVPGASVAVTDVTLSDISDVPDDGGGYGLVADAAELTVTRARLERVGTTAIVSVNPGAVLTTEDVHVLDSTGDTDGVFGYGVGVELGGTATLTRTLVERARGIGVIVGGNDVSFVDLAVLDTAPNPAGDEVRGVEIQQSGTIDIDGLTVRGAGHLGLHVRGEETQALVANAEISDTVGLPCAATGCDPLGVSVGVYEGGYLSMRDFLVTRSRLAGLHLAGGTADLLRGEISDGVIGAAVSTDPFDIDRITDQVAYRNNAVNLDTTSLPVPEPGRRPPRFVPMVSRTPGL